MQEVSSYSYDSSKQELITFDTPDIVKAKSDYIVKNGLAGTMFWQLGGDKEGTDSLVATAARQFGTLDQTPNHVSYALIFYVIRRSGAELEFPDTQAASMMRSARAGARDSKLWQHLSTEY